jgi:predicted nucleic-acid-binding protein
VIVVPTIALCELVWVLKRAYRYAGPEIINILRRLVAICEVETERPAAGRYRDARARGYFADGVVRYEADSAKCDRLVIFNQRSARLLGPGKVSLLGTRPKP